MVRGSFAISGGERGGLDIRLLLFAFVVILVIGSLRGHERQGLKAQAIQRMLLGRRGYIPGLEEERAAEGTAHVGKIFLFAHRRHGERSAFEVAATIAEQSNRWPPSGGTSATGTGKPRLAAS
jgi:hypothetical protein